MTRILLLGDLHNRWNKTAEVLRQAGVMAHDGSRVPGWKVVQIGDALSLGYDEVEAEFFTWLEDWVDLWCLGNHELASCYFDNRHVHVGYSADRFRGWHTGADLEAVRLVRKKFRAKGYVAATTVGKYLVSHAGVLPRFQRKYGMRNKSVEEVAEWINARFYRAMEERVGCDLLQGPASMFWVRIGELQNGYGSAEHHLPQIVGHSCVGPKEVVPGKLWIIDSPPVHHPIHGGVVGLVFDENEEVERVVYVE